jgi:hypothetical protein
MTPPVSWPRKSSVSPQCERDLLGVGRSDYVQPHGKGKGCDIGYGLATSSCKGANSVDACTVTALDAITAFAVPDPNLLLAEPVGFFGSRCPANHFTEPDHSAYFGSATI